MGADICHFTPKLAKRLAAVSGWLVHYKNGSTAYIMSDPIHWPSEVIPQVLSVMPMQEPPTSTCNCINCTDGEPA